ncbi:hypothetical protein PPERSA_02734 [Pseudocohnilembus persalinus]|uniref:EF-hand domain-containing protein n=1 Tax=Pseudocohnilembus persalinus TaxID=266149 RepID=A0A0V0R725_PSEPJ|nr:hypothetical protein PPERSA_02734 [Pseudocohnilembus persalinus]|eukprot:KRX10317.1 hypothetical protein PPERSA_02734 [Pseudocohnilembus persalinus]
MEVQGIGLNLVGNLGESLFTEKIFKERAENYIYKIIEIGNLKSKDKIFNILKINMYKTLGILAFSGTYFQEKKQIVDQMLKILLNAAQMEKNINILQKQKQILDQILIFSNTSRDKLSQNGIKGLGVTINRIFKKSENLSEFFENQEEFQNCKKQILSSYLLGFQNSQAKVVWNTCSSYSFLVQRCENQEIQAFLNGNNQVLEQFYLLLESCNNFKTQIHCIAVLNSFQEKEQYGVFLCKMFESCFKLLGDKAEQAYSFTEFKFLEELYLRGGVLLIKLGNFLDERKKDDQKIIWEYFIKKSYYCQEIVIKFILQLWKLSKHELALEDQEKEKFITEEGLVQEEGIKEKVFNLQKKEIQQKNGKQLEEQQIQIESQIRKIQFDFTLKEDNIKKYNQKQLLAKNCIREKQNNYIKNQLKQIQKFCAKFCNFVDSNEEATVSFNVYDMMKSYSQIDINQNQLEQINFLTNFINLSELQIVAGKNINRLPDNLEGIQNLEILDLKDTQIEINQSFVNNLIQLRNLQILCTRLEPAQHQKLLTLLSRKNLQIVVQNESLKSKNNDKNQQAYQDDKYDFSNTDSPDNIQNKLRNNNNNNYNQSFQQQNGSSNKNGYQYQQEHIQNAQAQEFKLDLESIREIAKLYDQIRELYRQKNLDDDKKMEQHFDMNTKRILRDLKAKLDSFNKKKEIKENNFEDQNLVFLEDYNKQISQIKARYALIDICFDKGMIYLQQFMPQGKFVFEQLHDSLAMIFKDFSQIFQNFFLQFDYLIRIYQEKVNDQQIDLEEKQSEIELLQIKLEEQKNNQEKQIQAIVNNNDQFNAQGIQFWRQENYQLKEQLKNMEEENQNYLKKIIKLTKKNNGHLVRSNSNSPDRKKFINQGELQFQKSQSFIGQDESFNKSQIYLENNKVFKKFSLNQFKDFIQELYLAKNKYNEKQKKLGLVEETMEKYMYTYLNEKYGLKNMVLEYANSVIEAIKDYAPIDADVKLFGLILKNEVDEDFNQVQSQLKETIQNILKSFNMNLNQKSKQISEIEEIIKQKLKGYISLNEAQEIINYLYSEAETEFIYEKIDQKKIQASEMSHFGEDSLNNNKNRNYIQNQYQIQKNGKNQGYSNNNKQNNYSNQQGYGANQREEVIKYSEFEKILLDFQLNQYQGFLKPLVLIYRSMDIDLHGSINQKEYANLVEQFGSVL